MAVKTYYCRNKTVNFTQHLTIENVFVRRQTHTEREKEVSNWPATLVSALHCLRLFIIYYYTQKAYIYIVAIEEGEEKERNYAAIKNDEVQVEI